MSQTSRLAALVDKKYSGARQTTSERQYRRRRRRRVRCPQQQQQQRSYAISLSAAGKRRHDRSTGPPLAPSLPVINRRRPAGDVRATDRPRFNHLKSVPGGPTGRPAGWRISAAMIGRASFSSCGRKTRHVSTFARVNDVIIYASTRRGAHLLYATLIARNCRHSVFFVVVAAAVGHRYPAFGSSMLAIGFSNILAL